MHPHVVLMLASTAVIGLFVAIVVVVSSLRRSGRLGPAEGRLGLAAYGPILAGALSGGAAVVHLGVISTHAAQSAQSAATAGPSIALICSIGAGSAHFGASDASLAGFLPLGIASLAILPLQGAWTIPALWRRTRAARFGTAVVLVAVALSIVQVVAVPAVLGATRAAQGAPSVGPAGGLGTVLVPNFSTGIADGIGLAFEALLAVVGLALLTGRPRRFVARLDLSITDAWVGTSLGVGAVVIFGAAALLTGHTAH